MKDFYLYTLFDQHRVDIFDQVELWSPGQVTDLSLCRIFYFSWHRHQIEGTHFSVSSERHW